MSSPAVEDITATQDEPQDKPQAAEATTPPEELALSQAEWARRRANHLPYLLTAATGVAGTAAWGVAAAAAEADLPVAVSSGVAGVACLGVAALVRRIKRNVITEEWRNYYWRTCSAMAGLVSLEAFCGATWGGASALGALGTTFVASEVLSARWRRAHEVAVEPYVVPELDRFEATRILFNRKYVCRADRERKAAEAEAMQIRQSAEVALVEAATMEALDPAVSELKRNWACNVAPGAGVMPGAKLTDVKRIDETRIRAVIETRPGTCAYDDVMGLKARLASALFVLRSRISVREHPTSEHLAIVTIALGTVLGEISKVPYQGPRYDNGRIPLGPTREGGYAFVDLKGDGGANHLLATGSWRSGKTGTVELIALASLNSGEWIWLWCDGDPKGGSSPLLNRICHAAGAGPEDALRQLEAVEAEFERRSIAKQMTTIDKTTGRPVPITDPLTQVAADKLVPCREFPGFVWALDEWKRFMDDEYLQAHDFAARVEHLARVTPKYGMAIVVSTHSILRQDYNGSTVFRGLLAAVNFLAFRTINRREADAIHGVEVCPYELPEGGGYFYSTRSGGATMARAEYPDDEKQEREHWAAVVLQTRARPNPDTELILAPLRETAPADPIEAVRNAERDLEQWRAAQQAHAAPGVDATAEQGIDADLAAWPGAADLIRETLGRPLTLIPGGRGNEHPELTDAELKTLAALPAKLGQLPYGETYNRTNIKNLVQYGLAVQPKELGPYYRTPAGDKLLGIEPEADAEADRESAEVELERLAN